MPRSTHPKGGSRRGIRERTMGDLFLMREWLIDLEERNGWDLDDQIKELDRAIAFERELKREAEEEDLFGDEDPFDDPFA